MQQAFASFDCDGILADFEGHGFRLWRTYETLVEEYARRGDLRLGDRDPPNHRVQVFSNGIDTPLLGRDAPMWAAVDREGSVWRFEDFRTRLEAAKVTDESYPTSAAAWDGTKSEALYVYRRIGTELGLPTPTQSGSKLKFLLRVPLGELALELDTGGKRPRLAGHLPVYYYFKPEGLAEFIFLSNLAWIHPTFERYLQFVTVKITGGRVSEIEQDPRSAIHGVRASLVALQSLANKLTEGAVLRASRA